jgi:D-sedoheptulose 7-phosphate isomerase
MDDREIQQRFDDSAQTLHKTRELAAAIRQAAGAIIDCCRAGAGVLIFGNGGSAADAQHFAGELVGRFLRERRPLRAQALGTDASIATAVSNDYGFEQVFARQVRAMGSHGDVAIALSTSGNSANVIEALKAAREIGMTTIALTGRGGGKCAALADVLLAVPASHTPRIQEAHCVIYHVLCEIVENALAQ